MNSIVVSKSCSHPQLLLSNSPRVPPQEEWDQGQWELIGELLDEVTPILVLSHCNDCRSRVDRLSTDEPVSKPQVA